MSIRLTRFGKVLFTMVAVTFILFWAWLIVGCAGATIVPDRVESRTIAFEGNAQNAGVLVIDKAGAVLTEHKKAEYDALVALYGAGTSDYPLTPPVRPGEGLKRLRGKDAGFPDFGWVWRIDAEHLSFFAAFREWQRAGRKSAH